MDVLAVVCLSVLLAGAVHADCGACQLPVFEENIDWDLLNRGGPWYDVLDIPAPPLPVDCWNWVNFTSIEEYGDGLGFIDGWVDGTEGPGYRYHVHFMPVEGRKGIYAIHERHTHMFIENNRKASEIHPAGSEFEDLDKLSSTFYDFEYFIITDYKNYYILGTCFGDAGLAAWVKMSKQNIGVEDVALVSNAMLKHGLVGNLFVKDKCISRKYNANC